MLFIVLSLVPVLLLVCWVVAEFRGQTWSRLATGFLALIAVAVVSFLLGGFAEGFKHTEFPAPHDRLAREAFMNAAENATNNVIK